ncbi:acetolactate decarboxylase [Polaribacter sp. R77954]|uniref:acetolactate decarboxylase n=1 Tax=Polaribacter sp. R77954 TaxID=3093870 RepID=UPI0037C74914
MKKIVFLFTLLIFVGCTLKVQEKQNVNIVGAMKNVMWKGKLSGSINLDTIADKKGLYGLGPVSYLTGELLINNGKSYVSKVISDTTMIVEKSFDISAPFFVYSNINNWNEIKLPTDVKTIKDVEKFTKNQATNFKKPFAFKLIGQVAKAVIHIQNLPQGSKVSSPVEAHQGQINYTITNENCEIIGFFSTEHQGIFTHHDSFVHMHLITKDETKMGHLDELEIGEMKLYLPKK